jgi:phage shock protein A
MNAGLDSVVTAAEEVSGNALLRQALRELERAEESLRKEYAQIALRHEQAEADQKSCRAKAADMADNARYALTKGREDLATQAVAHQLDLEARADGLTTVQVEAEVELRQLEEAVAELTARREQMRRDIAAAASNAAPVGRPKPSPQAKVESATARANQIFERAIGRTGEPLCDPTTAAGLAEVNVMKRDDAIADRLATMRESLGKPAKKPKR